MLVPHALRRTPRPRGSASAARAHRVRSRRGTAARRLAGDPGSATDDGSERPPRSVLAATDVMGVTAVATAANGAVLDIQLVVHAPEPFSADGAADACGRDRWPGAPARSTTASIADQGFSFTTVDVTATTRAGQWPADTPLLLLPLPVSAARRSRPAATCRADQRLDRRRTWRPASVPHCAQPVLLTGAGHRLDLSGHRRAMSTATPSVRAARRLGEPASTA